MQGPVSFWITAAASAAFLALAPAALAAGEPASPATAPSATTQTAPNETPNPLEKLTGPRTSVQHEHAKFKKNHPAHPTHMTTKFGTKTGTHS